MVDIRSVAKAFSLWMRYKGYSDTYSEHCYYVVLGILNRFSGEFIGLDRVREIYDNMRGKSRTAYTVSWNRFMEYLEENGISAGCCGNVLRVSELYKWLVNGFREWLVSKGYSESYIKQNIRYIEFLINLIGGLIDDIEYIRGKLWNKSGCMRGKYVRAWKLFMEYLYSLGIGRWW